MRQAGEVTVYLRDLVVLDVGGVLLTDLVSRLIPQVASAAGASEAAVRHAYLSHGLREALWCGDTSTEDFWATLGQRLNSRFDGAEWDERCSALQVPLMSGERLDELFSTCDVALLTNHRTNWLLPTLRREALLDCFAAVVVSDLERCMKPSPAIYQALLSRLPARYGRRLYVDDKATNLPPARALGFDTMVADAGTSWEEMLTQWIRRSKP